MRPHADYLWNGIPRGAVIISMKPMSKAQRAAGRETSAPQSRPAVAPENPGASTVRCAMPIGDAIADANTLRMFIAAHRRPSSRRGLLLAVLGREGSRAVVEALDGLDRAGASAEAAAHAAFRAVPGLRG